MKTLRDISAQSDTLKRLIEDNPSYPVVVLGPDDIAGENWEWIPCGNVEYAVARYLDCEVPYQSNVEFSERHFIEEIQAIVKRECEERDGYEHSPQYLGNRSVERAAQYERFWKKMIAVRAIPEAKN